MIKWNLTRPEEMLFALLRASLHQKEVEMSYFQNVTNEDWTDCFRIASEQGVAALAWDALITLPIGWVHLESFGSLYMEILEESKSFVPKEYKPILNESPYTAFTGT